MSPCPQRPLRCRATSRPKSRIAALRLDAVAYEHGNGQPKDGLRAAALYCQAAKLGDAASQFDLGWMYANGRGVQRDDALAAFFFQRRGSAGPRAGQRMLKPVGEPGVELPECMRDPVVAGGRRAAPGAPAGARLRAPIVAPRPIARSGRRSRRSTKCAAAGARDHRAESNFNRLAVSPKNAQGLMQLIPETASRFGVKNAFDPAQNVRGGIAYLRWLLAYFEGDVRLVAAAYNAGERAVERHLGVPPFHETRDYVRRILAASARDAVRCQRHRAVAAVALIRERQRAE